jgi:hypothetical protein
MLFRFYTKALVILMHLSAFDVEESKTLLPGKGSRDGFGKNTVMFYMACNSY